jgi:hypothetical protein
MRMTVTTPAGSFEVDKVDSYQLKGAVIELHKKSTAAGQQTLLAIVGIGPGVHITVDGPGAEAQIVG